MPDSSTDLLKIGLVSSSQLSFFGDKEGVFSRMSKELGTLAEKLRYTLYVYPKTVITPEDAYTAVKTLEAEAVDLVLLQNTSYSSGFLAPIFAKVQGAVLGLWAIPEFVNGGPVPFNSFCSINMYSGIIGHYLNEDNIPLKWFYGDVQDPLFMNRFTITVRALGALKKLRNSSVALIGGVAPGFNDLYDDERKIIRRLPGLRINRLHEWNEIRDRAVKYTDAEIKPYIDRIRAKASAVQSAAEPWIADSARFEKAYDDFLASSKYDALAISCWPKFQDEFKYSVCSTIANLNEKGTVAACEGDLTSAISMLLLHYLADDTTTLMDMSAFDEKDDTVLMWHCGPAAPRFGQKNGYELGVNYSGMAHEKGKPPVVSGVAHDMIIDSGEITIARFAGEWDKIFLAGGSFIDYKKESYCGSRGWVGNLTFNRKSIGARDFVNTILAQRFSHHFPIVYGDYTKEVMEIMSWLGMAPIKRIDYEDYLQRPED
jgi:L-fucose isomerase-like protein